MDHLQNQSYPKTFSNSENKNPSSNEEDGEVFSLSELNENEIFLERLDEIADNLDLCANDDVGNICLESQQYRFDESEQGTSQLTENNATVSNINTSNENAASNLAPDSRFILLQQGNPLDIWPSSCLFGVPPYISYDKEEIGNYTTTSECVASAYDFIESNPNSQIDSSNDEYGEVFSLSEMNELVSCLAQPDEMTDNLDLYTNDDVGNICLESQQYRFGESEQGTSQLTENNESFSNMNASYENTASYLAPDSRFTLLQQGNSLGIWPSSCLFGVPPYVSDDKEEEIGTYSTTSESVVSECDILKSYIRGYIETFQSTLHEQNKVRSSTSITAKSSEEYRAARYVNNRDVFYETDVCMPESYEGSEKGTFLNYTNIAMAADYTGNCGFSRGQRDDDELQNNMLLGEVSKASDRRSSEFCNSWELLIPANDKCTVVGPSSTNAEVQCHLDDGRFVCPTCGKVFGRENHLVSHYRTHTGEKPFVCEKCKKRFGRSSDLTRHRRTHTGEKPFACDKCGNTFRQSIDLARHRRTHTGEKPYKCSICGKAFTRSSSRNYHYKNVHSQK
ncbi:Zinc finger protein with KRAB and SCAN domains 3 [Araneus ventricosus]|uniref:Zinc finger protein with KRAB and SCAN domains 3 n=1 Tax=Araneus ventricosus TaxID=182803 RepID=A0A4Y2KZ88_ARAVE|nr:Zinc finger protein with KRAB and SCAN domains 3 [Araneus ventricosus]